jgi:SsrA-binding protein
MAKKSKSRKTAAPKPTASAGQPHYRTVADNRRARFNFEVIESVEAGIALTGTEVKSIRAGRVNIRDAYGLFREGELWLQNLHIASWAAGGPWNHEPLRTRKLLIHRSQLNRLAAQVGQQGLTLVPLRLYLKDHHVKVELALAKGRRRYDKRKRIMERETGREIARAIRERSR